MPGGWWLVVGYMVLTWSLHGPKCVLPTLMILIILIQFDLVVWWGSQQKPTSDKPNINQSGLGFLRSGPMKSFAH